MDARHRRHFEVRPIPDSPRSSVRCKICGATRVGFEPELTSWAGFHSHTADAIRRSERETEQSEPSLVDASYLHMEQTETAEPREPETPYSNSEQIRAAGVLANLNRPVHYAAIAEVCATLRAAETEETERTSEHSFANRILFREIRRAAQDMSLRGDSDTPHRTIRAERGPTTKDYRQGYLDGIRRARYVLETTEEI